MTDKAVTRQRKHRMKRRLLGLCMWEGCDKQPPVNLKLAKPRCFCTEHALARKKKRQEAQAAA